LVYNIDGIKNTKVLFSKIVNECENEEFDERNDKYHKIKGKITLFSVFVIVITFFGFVRVAECEEQSRIEKEKCTQ
jgi:hypothetical protein